MPFALIVIGVIILVAGIRGTHVQLGHQLAADFTGAGNFIYWLIAVGVIGLIGYVPGLDRFSKAFMVLLALSFILANRGFFNQFNAAIKSGTAAPSAPVNEANSIPAFNGSSSGNGSVIGSVAAGAAQGLVSGLGL